MSRALAIFAGLTAVIVIVAACSSSEPTAVSQPTATARPALQVDRTPTPRPGATLRGASIGDHWHAALLIAVCGQPFIVPGFPAGIHSHGDGLLHIHPSASQDAGNNATFGRFLELATAGRVLTLGADSIQLPGGPEYRDGDTCPNGAAGTLRVTINGTPTADFLDYLMQDGDQIEVLFG